MRIVFLFCIYLQFFGQINGGDILIIELVPFSSYANIMRAIIHTLAPYHQIAFYSVLHKEFNHPNVTLHPIVRPYLHIMSIDDIFVHLAENKKFHVAKDTMLGSTDEYVEDLLKVNSNLRDLIKSNKSFDLFFTYTHISEHLIPFSHVVKAPLVLVSPGTPLPWHNVAIGNPNFLSYDYSLLIDANNDYFFNRLINYTKHFILTFLYNWHYIPNINKVCQRMFPPGTPSLAEMYNNASLLIVNTHDVMGFSRPSITNSIQVGGIHCKPPKPLPKDLEEFIQGSGKHGFIYFSLGTTIQAKVPKEVTAALLQAFSKIPQRVLWKWNDIIENLPENIKVSNWFPQQDILGHNKIKLLISHGGMLSLQESVYHSVPILVIPITFDQPTNAHLVQKLGYGRYINFNQITEERLSNDIQEILTNKQYKEKVKTLSTLMKDQPLSPGNRLKWWADYLIRHKGFPVYRPKDNRYSWTAIIETDILAFFIVVTCINIIILRFLVRSITKKIRYYTGFTRKVKTT